MANSKNKCSNCWFKSNVVSVLNDKELELLHESSFVIKYRKGESVLKEGTPVQNIIYLRQGFIKFSKTGLNGNETILNVAKPGSFLGIYYVTRKFDTNSFSAITISECEVCHINIDFFYKMLKENGSFAIEVLSFIFCDAMNYFERMVNNVQHQLPGRIASILIQFKDQIYYKNKFNLNLTRSELSSLVGASRESVSRILNEFKEEGIIAIEGSSIEIINEKRLIDIKHKG